MEQVQFEHVIQRVFNKTQGHIPDLGQTPVNVRVGALGGLL
jgi:hypothetical protein